MNTTVDQITDCQSSPLENVAREQVLSRLREALKLAETGFAENLAPLTEIFEDLVDRTEAFELVRSANQVKPPARPASLLKCAAFSAHAGDPVKEFLLIPFGEVSVERPCAGGSFVFTREHAEAALRWFENIGRKLAIDYEHQSFDRFNTRADGLRPAAGWIGGLEIREDGLWAVEVTWTERAGELLRAGEYRYFSPVIFWTDENQTALAALGPVALTNDPAMCGVHALAAARALGTGQSDSAADDEESVSGGPGGGETSEELEPGGELAAARDEIAVLKRQIAGQAADSFVERGLRAGKILDACSLDWRDEYLRDPQGTEARLARAPVLLPPGRVLALDRRGEVAPVGAAEQEYRRHAELYGRWGVDSEDLAAYERAATAGRVWQGGSRAP